MAPGEPTVSPVPEETVSEPPFVFGEFLASTYFDTPPGDDTRQTGSPHQPRNVQALPESSLSQEICPFPFLDVRSKPSGDIVSSTEMCKPRKLIRPGKDKNVQERKNPPTTIQLLKVAMLAIQQEQERTISASEKRYNDQSLLLRELQASNSSKQTELEMANKEKADLQNKLSVATTKIQGMQSRLDILNDGMKELEGYRQSVRRECEDLRRAALDLKQDRRQVRSEIDKHLASMKDLKSLQAAQIKEIRQQFEYQDAQSAKLQEELTTKSSELTAERVRSSQAHEEQMTCVRASEAEVAAQKGQLNQSKAMLAAETARNRNNVDVLAATRLETENCRALSLTVSEKVVRLEGEVHGLKEITNPRRSRTLWLESETKGYMETWSKQIEQSLRECSTALMTKFETMRLAGIEAQKIAGQKHDQTITELRKQRIQHEQLKADHEALLRMTQAEHHHQISIAKTYASIADKARHAAEQRLKEVLRNLHEAGLPKAPNAPTLSRSASDEHVATQSAHGIVHHIRGEHICASKAPDVSRPTGGQSQDTENEQRERGCAHPPSDFRSLFSDSNLANSPGLVEIFENHSSEVRPTYDAPTRLSSSHSSTDNSKENEPISGTLMRKLGGCVPRDLCELNQRAIPAVDEAEHLSFIATPRSSCVRTSGGANKVATTFDIYHSPCNIATSKSDHRPVSNTSSKITHRTDSQSGQDSLHITTISKRPSETQALSKPDTEQPGKRQKLEETLQEPRHQSLDAATQSRVSKPNLRSSGRSHARSTTAQKPTASVPTVEVPTVRATVSVAHTMATRKSTRAKKPSMKYAERFSKA